MSSPRRRAHRARAAGSVEGVGALAVGCWMCLGLWLWAAGEIAGRVTSGSWPAVDPLQAGMLAFGVLSRPGRPDAAWPPAVRRVVGGTAAIYCAALAIGAAAGTGAVLATALARRTRTAVALRWTRRRSGRGGRSARPRPPGARTGWGGLLELAGLVVDRPVSGRLTLGRCGRALIAAEPRQSVLVVGPTQTHKTTGFAVPAVLEWDGPVLATSVKADLLRETIAWRETRGNVWVLDPTASTGLPGAGWSPLAACGTWAGAQQMASWMCGGAVRRAGMADGEFWYATAAKLLAPLYLAAATSGRTMADVVRWVDSQEEREPAAALERAGVEEAVLAAEASWRREPRQRSSVYTTAETVVATFADPRVAALTARPEIEPRRLLDGGAHSLYLCAPSHEQDRLQPLFATVVHHVLTTAFEQASVGGVLDPPLLVVLDEAANVAPLANLDGLAATAAGHGVQLVTVWQDLAQVEARYGARAATVVNNHRAKVVLSGVSDPATLDHVSRLMGDEEIFSASRTVDASGASSTTESPSLRRLAPADALRRIPPGEAVLVYGHLPPAHLRLRPWFREPELSRRVRAGRG
ncbi:MAG TPA: type IV secretory system conjugative DNA transfer family protein [Acidimicrobiales bacterium]|nr:type IV secretory system conjugative DNA transfer family protein [Acidimicrobiales bacterium]